MTHLIHTLTNTAKTVITFPLNAAKAVAAPALRRVGVLHDDSPQGSEQRSPQPPEPRTPPVRRTAEEAVARERASESAQAAAAETGAGTGAGTGAALDDERYDDYDEPAPSGNAAAAPGAGADSGSRKKKQGPDEPVLDTAAAKAVRTEAETMSRAADPRKD